MRTLDGREVTLEELIGHVVLVTAGRHRELLAELNDEFLMRGLHIVVDEVGELRVHDPAGAVVGRFDVDAEPDGDAIIGLLEQHLPL
ncbi:hypothetical protein [Corynebacterium sphenisci]|uniref:hypothetical protein n=1 Tax=Corynebacterium sphenisci TaxID=191493 RepID=UPI0026DED7F5|nr:hypothetical protein [Corynebacterium sphenisci]MDO5730171.1 hypothetical protein [Corynebacterium sphenisci]